MTLEQFFKKLKVYGAVWILSTDQENRNPRIRTHTNLNCQCPVSYVANKVAGKAIYTAAEYLEAAEYLGLDKQEARSIAHMADVASPQLWDFIVRNRLNRV